MLPAMCAVCRLSFAALLATYLIGCAKPAPTEPARTEPEPVRANPAGAPIPAPPKRVEPKPVPKATPKAEVREFNEAAAKELARRYHENTVAAKDWYAGRWTFTARVDEIYEKPLQTGHIPVTLGVVIGKDTVAPGTVALTAAEARKLKPGATVKIEAEIAEYDGKAGPEGTQFALVDATLK